MRRARSRRWVLRPLCWFLKAVLLEPKNTVRKMRGFARGANMFAQLFARFQLSHIPPLQSYCRDCLHRLRSKFCLCILHVMCCSMLTAESFSIVNEKRTSSQGWQHATPTKSASPRYFIASVNRRVSSALFQFCDFMSLWYLVSADFGLLPFDGSSMRSSEPPKGQSVGGTCVVYDYGRAVGDKPPDMDLGDSVEAYITVKLVPFGRLSALRHSNRPPGCVARCAPVRQESWVECDKCERWFHTTCALFYEHVNDSTRTFWCPHCILDEKRK